jgi:signal transduction histidine kinase
VISILVAVTAVLGRYMARSRAFVRGLVVRTEELERDRELLAREAVAMERARIARELHDVVAHHVSVMVIQAGAAQATLPPGADTTAQSLEAVRQTGREAMAEMRRLLGLLRSDGPLENAPVQGGANSGQAGATADVSADPARSPQPGLADLESLADRTREAGLIVDLEVLHPARVPAGVDLSAYRIVQEALTNTLRHAGVGARVHVCVDHQPDELIVEIVDDGRGRRPAIERARNEVGHGLLGMRERVALFGGSLSAGPRPEGGFRVAARFPLEPVQGGSTVR